MLPRPCRISPAVYSVRMTMLTVECWTASISARNSCVIGNVSPSEAERRRLRNLLDRRELPRPTIVATESPDLRDFLGPLRLARDSRATRAFDDLFRDGIA